MLLYWHKAMPSQYYLRTTPGGRGPSVGHVWRREKSDGGCFYNAIYDTAEAVICFTERGQPNSVIGMLEAQIVARFPDVTFTRENF